MSDCGYLFPPPILCFNNQQTAVAPVCCCSTRSVISGNRHHSQLREAFSSSSKTTQGKSQRAVGVAAPAGGGEVRTSVQARQAEVRGKLFGTSETNFPPYWLPVHLHDRTRDSLIQWRFSLAVMKKISNLTARIVPQQVTVLRNRVSDHQKM